jgi:hypothetical protein
MVNKVNFDHESFMKIAEAFWDDRVLFAYKAIGFKKLDPQQEDILRELDKADHVSVKAGHDTGKTTTEAICALHYLSTRPECRVVCTAPSKHQLNDILWAEISHQLGMMKKTEVGRIFETNLDWKKETVVNVLSPATWFAAARTATKDNTESLQGFHGPYVLRIVDEASGVTDPAFETLEGATGRLETKSLSCGNPTRRDGQFYRMFNEDKEFYRTFTMSCLKSSIANPRYAARMLRKYGATSNFYRIRVLGEFPLSDPDTYIPLHWCEAARYRDIPPQTNYEKVFGVDVARSGNDRSVIAVRQGDIFQPYHVMHYSDTMKVVAAVSKLANEQKPKTIFIDIIGIGAGVYDRLKELGYPVIAVNVSETISMEFPERYERLRDELWGKMRDWLEIGRGRIWDNEDSDLIGELSAPKAKYTASGKIKIESKDELRARVPGLGSPDIADAHIMTFALPVSNYNKELDNEFENEDNIGMEIIDSKAGY